MKLTKIGKDVIKVDENNYLHWCDDKIHIIKLQFKYPTKEKIYKVFDNYKKTNRFIIDNNIRFYNFILKNVNKKYYICNTVGKNIVTFFKKNNKIVLNTYNLNDYELKFLKDDRFLLDLLYNLEVIITDEEYYNEKKYIFQTWSGNVIISDGNDI